MKRKGFYKEDWFIALLVGLVFLAGSLLQVGFLEKFETMAYDAGVKMTSRTPGATDNIVIISIDEPSIKAIGRWPWPRSVMADMIDFLKKADAKAVGLLVFFTEPQADPGLTHIRQIREYVEKARLPRAADTELRKQLAAAETALDSDARLAQAIPAAGNVYLPILFVPGETLGKPDKALPEFITRHKLDVPPLIQKGVESARKVEYPIDPIGKSARGIGHLNLLPREGSAEVRSVGLMVEYYGHYYPSLPLLLAARQLNLDPKDIEVKFGEGVKLGRLNIRTNDQMRMLSAFYPKKNDSDGDGTSAFTQYPFVNVRDGSFPESRFKDKIVLIGPTAAGLSNYHPTPLGTRMTDTELNANFIASILNQDFYVRPVWAEFAEAGFFLVVILYLMLVMPRLPGQWAAGTSLALLLLLVLAGHYLLVSEKLWLRTISPALLLFAGHLLITSKRFFLTERLKSEAEIDSAQNNRMLGLAFQSQGQLDSALDKFRRLPVDESVLELIYNLALDFERKRQFSKAGNCYDYILKHDNEFKDAVERKKRAVAAENTVILGGKGGSATGTLILDGFGQRPTLGRYEVERELGKGAMGTVYFGRDPRINRTVAIKTLALSQEFEEGELEKVRERFFREAETAGRLTHPNIVTIYDAGEEHDLAYIAMEFLEGKDLTSVLQKGKLPPVEWTVDVIAQVADALDYAHRHEVVHRDIKPANIMYNDKTRTVKVTDFGIARITASSRTKTGVVMGTPSYMSPEQIAGKHVDGRSDLFSLGVTLYELLTGKQPFAGDSLANLMYQIANEKPPDLLEQRDGLPACLKTVVDKTLVKNPDKRYQTCMEFRDALLKCVPVNRHATLAGTAKP